MSGYMIKRLRYWLDGVEEKAVFGYDVDEPFSVRLHFLVQGKAIVWEFARDVLTAGLTALSGDGDVKVIPVGQNLEIILSSPTGREILVFDRAELVDALAITERMMPSGQETFNFDAELASFGVRHD
jgi:hypothetical protein